jgi:hypothetical protein
MYIAPFVHIRHPLEQLAHYALDLGGVELDLPVNYPMHVVVNELKNQIH